MSQIRLLDHLESQVANATPRIRSLVKSKEEQINYEIQDFIKSKNYEFNHYTTDLIATTSTNTRPIKIDSDAKHKRVNFSQPRATPLANADQPPPQFQPQLSSSLGKSAPISIRTNPAYIEGDGGRPPPFSSMLKAEDAEDHLISQSLLRSRLQGETDTQKMSFSERMEYENIMHANLGHK